MEFLGEKARKDWQIFEKNNQDIYGKGVVQFAKRWAELMENDLANGKQVHEIAKKREDEADIEGITGFMYGAAVSILSQVWRYGEELKYWHNSNNNYKGNGVANPAIMTVQSKES